MKQIHDRIVFRPYRDRTRACSGQPHAFGTEKMWIDQTKDMCK